MSTYSGRMNSKYERIRDEIYRNFGTRIERSHDEHLNYSYAKRLVNVFSILPLETKAKLVKLYDHKGCLEVYWRKMPDDYKEMLGVSTAWEVLGGEPMENTSHYVLNSGKYDRLGMHCQIVLHPDQDGSDGTFLLP